MFNFFTKNRQRVSVQDNAIHIDNSESNVGKTTELNTVFSFKVPVPQIDVYENKKLIRNFRIDTLAANPDLSGQFFHSSIRILVNSGVMIDGIISKNADSFPATTGNAYEGIRLQPFFLSNAQQKNEQMKGKGLFERGLHFSGMITPAYVRAVCICDQCSKSFSVQHFHAGFSEMQYFYSSNSRETLTVPYNAIAGMPVQLQESIDPQALRDVEEKLPPSTDGTFRYYNPFRCVHCLAPYIDFENNKAMRPKEYYGLTLLNEKPKQFTGSNAQ